MSSDSEINHILSFWFDPHYPWTRWFIPSSSLDAQITHLFSSLVLLARNTSQLDHWAQSPAGALALILLLDQFPRNIFRNSADAFRSDAKALSFATRAIAQGLDQAVPLIQQAFFYLPFEHDEALLSQVACVALYQGLVARSQEGSQEREFADKSVGYAVRHRDVIAAFGRFPGRNAVLRRHSTPEELEFLRTHPQGF